MPATTPQRATLTLTPLPVAPARDVLHAPDGTALAIARWLPEAPRATVLLSHGYGEHIGRYGHVITALAARDYAVFALDHRGHGRSSGPRAQIRRFDDYVDDLHLLARQARQTLPGLPLVLLGHSMGGLIAVRYALQHQSALAALITTGAALLVGEDVPTPLRRLGGLVAAVAPAAPVRTGPKDVLSTDPAVERDFACDPRCHGGPVKAALGHAFSSAAADARPRLGTLTLPLLTMHGAADQLTDPTGSRLLHARAASPDKTLHLWPGLKHELFNEPSRHEVITVMLGWLDERFAPQSPAPGWMTASTGR